jgi:tetraacyldisaccharide 4'-kinase
MRGLDSLWYTRNFFACLLSPLSALYGVLAALRRAAYRFGLKRVTRLPVPVIIVGNITVGGTGKTPLTIWLVNFLRQHGYRPGIITRGYRGRTRDWPRVVTSEAKAEEVGDEPLLLARHGGCPVVIDPVRPRGAQHLIDHFGCNVIVSDDGLQHYALARDVEIAVIDGARRFGNGLCLPAGPLREPRSRLACVDAVVTQGVAEGRELAMQLVPGAFQQITTGQVATVSQFHGRAVHAVAGIGHPARFFATLRGLGLEVLEHPFPDHHAFSPADVRFADGLPVIMTEKDAVKCGDFAGDDGWFLSVTATPDPRLGALILKLLKERSHG